MKHDEASAPAERQEIIVCRIRRFEKKNDLLPPRLVLPRLLCCFFNSQPRKKGEWAIAFAVGASFPVRSGLRKPAGIVIVIVDRLRLVVGLVRNAGRGRHPLRAPPSAPLLAVPRWSCAAERDDRGRN